MAIHKISNPYSKLITQLLTSLFCGYRNSRQEDQLNRLRPHSQQTGRLGRTHFFLYTTLSPNDVKHILRNILIIHTPSKITIQHLLLYGTVFVVLVSLLFIFFILQMTSECFVLAILLPLICQLQYKMRYQSQREEQKG